MKPCSVLYVSNIHLKKSIKLDSLSFLGTRGKTVLFCLKKFFFSLKEILHLGHLAILVDDEKFRTRRLHEGYKDITLGKVG